MPCPVLIEFSPSSLPNGMAGDGYLEYVTLYGVEVDLLTLPLSYWVSSGSLPPGLAPINGAEFLEISGTPTTAGSYTFTISADDSVGCTYSQEYTIIIDAAPTTPKCSDGMSGTVEDFPGGTGNWTWNPTLFQGTFQGNIAGDGSQVGVTELHWIHHGIGGSYIFNATYDDERWSWEDVNKFYVIILYDRILRGDIVGWDSILYVPSGVEVTLSEIIDEYGSYELQDGQPLAIQIRGQNIFATGNVTVTVQPVCPVSPSGVSLSPSPSKSPSKSQSPSPSPTVSPSVSSEGGGVIPPEPPPPPPFPPEVSLSSSSSADPIIDPRWIRTWASCCICHFYCGWPSTPSPYSWADFPHNMYVSSDEDYEKVFSFYNAKC